ncbi:EVE domain-containing protein [Carnobacterium maltaromaticum]|uniref:EVE domain-containing protein n=1 Tax=Carnobacterium maltaromaticum TaxID=2751 RepID=UPI000C7681FF|nr:EVE domain-containing protein [Carnobacterium maltaromaticum]PLS38073.1 EVE domain-containing protein [Carnobacterium maltaromaticum]PLS38450.1 EVE domain-containing protein [Carnobacterium maltaromaticum]PLS38827.1 EVE domain-containing protein [Carnobacterium maltaromaticum]PLS45097.1 EVE domain-containing protein [Carnobacterium maltaromaticum]PLS47953.1 EVE domain-containing protein [Carnobacterium maltaromaticum]
MIKYWIGVASKEHVLLGVNRGFCQLSHGKKAPLTRMKKGDKILYYAPKISMNTPNPYQKIVAVGTIADDSIYEFEMAPNFIPFRRNVLFEKIEKEVTLQNLRKFPEWNQISSKLRFGHFEISQNLYQLIYDKLKNE